MHLSPVGASLALAFALTLALIPTPSRAASVETDGPTAAALVYTNTTSGVLYFSQYSPHESLRFFGEFLHSSEARWADPAYNYRIHTGPIAKDCSSPGPIFSPPDANTTLCTAGNSTHTCALGDLSGRHGPLVKGQGKTVKVQGFDPVFNLTGPHGVIGQSLFLTTQSGQAIGCANISHSKDVDYSIRTVMTNGGSASSSSLPSSALWIALGAVFIHASM